MEILNIMRGCMVHDLKYNFVHCTVENTCISTGIIRGRLTGGTDSFNY